MNGIFEQALDVTPWIVGVLVIDDEDTVLYFLCAVFCIESKSLTMVTFMAIESISISIQRKSPI